MPIYTVDNCNSIIIRITQLPSHLPLAKGIALQTDKAPRLAYCPITTSIENNGIPQTINIIKYGTKNVPEKYK